MYEKKIDMNNREELAAYLSHHFRYDTMRSWNRSTSYANRVKIQHLDLPEDVREKAWDFVCGEYECSDWNFIVDDEIFRFQMETGYSAGFNGRSGGYLVLYEMGKNKTGQTVVYPGRSIDMYADFYDEDEWDLASLQDRAKLVQRFDQLCDDLRNEFIYFLRNSKIEEYEVVTTHKRLVMHDE